MKLKHVLPAVAITLVAIACSNNSSRPVGGPAAQGSVQQAGVNPADQLVANEWCAMTQENGTQIGLKYSFQRDGIVALETTYYTSSQNEPHSTRTESRWEITSAQGVRINEVHNLFQVLNRRHTQMLRLQESEENILFLANCESDLAVMGQAALTNISQEPELNRQAPISTTEELTEEQIRAEAGVDLSLHGDILLAPVPQHPETREETFGNDR